MSHREPYPVSCVHGKHRSHSSVEQISLQMQETSQMPPHSVKGVSFASGQSRKVIVWFTFRPNHRCSFCSVSVLNFDVVFFLSVYPTVCVMLSKIVDCRKWKLAVKNLPLRKDHLQFWAYFTCFISSKAESDEHILLK